MIERVFPGKPQEILAQLNAPAVFGTTSFFRPTPPTITVRAATDVCVLTMSHPAHEKLRQRDPRTAEALAVAVVRVLAERFDMLDKRVSDFLAQHADDQPKTTEWSRFRAVIRGSEHLNGCPKFEFPPPLPAQVVLPVPHCCGQGASRPARTEVGHRPSHRPAGRDPTPVLLQGSDKSLQIDPALELTVWGTPSQ